MKEKQKMDKGQKTLYIILFSAIAAILVGVGTWLLIFNLNKKHETRKENVNVVLNEKIKPTENVPDEEKEGTEMYNHLISLGADENVANELINKYYNHIISKEDLYKITSFHTEKDVMNKFIELSNKIGVDYKVLEILTPSRDGNVYASNYGIETIENNNDRLISVHKITDAFNANAKNNYISEEYKVFQEAIIKFHSANIEDAFEAIQKAINIIK